MIRILLLIIILVLALLGVRWFLKTPAETIAGYLKKIGLGAVVLLLILLAATGRLNGFFALFGVLVAFVVRFLPVILRYAPQLQRLWFFFQQQRGAASGNQQGAHRKAQTGKMTVTEAYEILGLKPGASKQDIIMAHKRLMQKNHPDRGGSDYLASRINQAKETLLS